jgi:hypothetical protein
MKWNDLGTFTFGDNPSLADDLAALVLAGRTCYLLGCLRWKGITSDSCWSTITKDQDPWP